MNTLLKEENLYEDCFHCGLEIARGAESAVIAGIEKVFYCSGCKSVCEYIFGAGLQAFYDRRAGARPDKPPELDGLLGQSFLDDSEFITEQDGGLMEAVFMVEGIHCSACIWLIERVVNSIHGVRYARINFTTNRMVVRWEGEGSALLEAIVGKVSEVGYRAAPFDSAKGAEALEGAKRDLLSRISVGAFAMVATMFFAEGLYGGYFWGIESGYRNLLQYLSLVVSVPLIFYAGSPFLVGSYKAIKARHITMDLPVAIGLLMTFFYSAWATVTARSDVYFDCAAMFVFLILLGRYFELAAKKKARMDSERLFGLSPSSATVIRDDVSSVVNIREVVIGDVVEVAPGENIPLDGQVIFGRAGVDESMLTGESTVVIKEVGAVVFGGTINTDGSLRLRVTSTGDKTVLAKLRRLVESAQLEKAAIEKFTDRVARVFVPLLLAAAAATFVAWLFIDPSRAMIITVTVLIVSCPCALALAVPAAVVSAIGRGSRHGIIVKSSAVFEQIREATRVVFDKTGTLTEGRPVVTDVILNSKAEVGEGFLLMVAAVVEAHSEHPHGKAIVSEAKERQIFKDISIEDFHAHVGRGVSAKVDLSNLSNGRFGLVEILVGSLSFMDGNGLEVPSHLQKDAVSLSSEAKSVVCVAIKTESDVKLLGLIALKDKVREGALEMVAAIKERGLHVTMLTGDTLGLARVVARELGIDDIVAEVLPEEKEQVVADLKARGESVIMVGDGINDAPALAHADIGVAMGTGTNLAIESADVVLLNTNPHTLIELIELSAKTIGAIRQNLWFSFSYNFIMIPLAAFGFIIPLIAAIAMPLSSLVVIGNAVRLAGRFRAREVR